VQNAQALGVGRSGSEEKAASQRESERSDEFEQHEKRRQEIQQQQQQQTNQWESYLSQNLAAGSAPKVPAIPAMPGRPEVLRKGLGRHTSDAGASGSPGGLREAFSSARGGEPPLDAPVRWHGRVGSEHGDHGGQARGRCRVGGGDTGDEEAPREFAASMPTDEQIIERLM